MLNTPSAVDEARRWPFSFLTSFSVEAGGFSSCMERPAMAESTLVRGTVMVKSGLGEFKIEFLGRSDD